MGRSEGLTLRDVRSAFRLLNELQELRDDPAGQRRHLVDALVHLLGAEMGHFYQAQQFIPAGNPSLTSVVTGTVVDPGFVELLGHWGSQFPLEADPFVSLSVADPSPVRITRLSRLLRTEQWRRFGPFRELIHLMHEPDYLVGYYREAGSDRIAGVSLNRPKRFAGREQALLSLFVQEWSLLAHQGKLDPVNAQPVPLSPRQRQVYQRLLGGQAPKTIARELGLSLPTVRDHIQAIYRRLGVSAREELMAQALQNHWPRPPTTSTVTPPLSEHQPCPPPATRRP